MMNRDGYNKSLWQTTTADYSPDIKVPETTHFDVIIAGGGITGITTALSLQKAGKSVMVLEAQTVGFGTTGGTTAHLNTFMDTTYNVVQKKFSDADAKLLAKTVSEALSLIKHNIEEYNIDCDYKQLPGYLFSQDDKQTKELEAMRDATIECGVACADTDELPVQIAFEKVVVFDNQATFHPTRYLTALATAFEKGAGKILEHCRVTKLNATDDQNTIECTVGNFTCNNFIYATHIPPGVNLLHFRCAPYRSYAIAVKLENDADYPDALIYDMYDPYHYYRTQIIDGEKYFIAGGEDHKTGHESVTDNCFRNLEAHVRKYFKVKEVTHKWSSQYFEPVDGLPYIGNLPGNHDSVFVATGYGGNGMVYSAVAALLLTDMINGTHSDKTELFDPNRVKMIAGFSNFIKEAADVVGDLAKKIVAPKEKLNDWVELAPGEAKIVKKDGEALAVYKNEEGEIFALHAACTHIKCDVAWNSTERSWDCPCHGSRFSFTGEMLTGPARKDLEKS